jgi:DNA-binding transcriptional MocR family regulator
MYYFSRAVNSVHSADIKRLMRQSSGPGLISFAGGMPNNDLFPVREIDEIYSGLPDDLKKTCFQYGATSGFPALREAVEKRLLHKGLPGEGDKLLITTGSLQAISIITQEFINEGDVVLTENPSFVGALSVFETYGAEVHAIPIDEEGIRIEALIRKIESLSKKPKLLYLMPNFHNPAGITYSLQRRKDLLRALHGRDIIVLEDDAYNDLYFDSGGAELIKPLKAHVGYDVDIIYTGSFSKILGPGFRLGYMYASPDIFDKAETIKQALDACTSNFMQILAAEFMAGGYLEPYLNLLRSEYRERKNLLQSSLEEHMPDEVRWTEPKGGFYYWLRLPKEMSSTDLFETCRSRGVVFVTGRTFDPHNSKDNCLRLSFSNMPKKDIAPGIEILANAIKEKFVQNTNSR